MITCRRIIILWVYSMQVLHSPKRTYRVNTTLAEGGFQVLLEKLQYPTQNWPDSPIILVISDVTDAEERL